MAEQAGGGTPLNEIRLEEKRIALRRALKREYMRQAYHPENIEQGKRVFDAAFYRFNAIQNSTEYMVRNKGRTFGMWCLTFLIPVVLMTRQGLKDYHRYDKDCRAGKVAINHPQRKYQWFTW